MVEVYYYVPAEEVENVVQCGLKLSKWFDKEVLIDGESRKCLTALLNPKDDMEKFKSDKYRCVKLEILPKYCFVADSHLYLMGLSNPDAMELYYESVIPVEDYVFGSYRLPECLITSTVIGEYISVLEDRLGSPLLFDNSEELYLNNIMEVYQEKNTEFIDAMLYCFYSKLAEIGKLKKMEDKENRVAVFFDLPNNKRYTIKTPEIGNIY
ncbi:MAG TPA: hypothetical protein GXX36_09135 [Clostridiaceae bacterium]|nr:hypothetical protein [Clostridiaceae bacterium]